MQVCWRAKRATAPHQCEWALVFILKERNATNCLSTQLLLHCAQAKLACFAISPLSGRGFKRSATYWFLEDGVTHICALQPTCNRSQQDY